MGRAKIAMGQVKNITFMANFTEKAIIESLKELLEERPIDKITVKEITERCGVSRNTFYYHFHDVYDAILVYFMRYADDLVSEAEDVREASFIEGMNFLYENKKIIRHIYKSVDRMELNRFLDKVVYNYTHFVIEKECEGKTVSSKVTSIAADFYKNALMGSVLSWIDNDMKDSPESLALLYNSIFSGTIDPLMKSIENAVEKSSKK